MEKRKILLAVLLVLMFSVAFYLKTLPSSAYPSPHISTYDPFLVFRLSREIIINGRVPLRDPQANYPEGVKMWGIYPPLYPYFSVAAYYLLSIVTSTPMTNESFSMFFAYLPSFFGALAVASMVVLGYSMRGGNKGLACGLLASILFLFTPLSVFKTSFGIAEEDAMGIFLLILSVAGYTWAFRKGGWKRGVVAGSILSLLTLTWRMSIYVGGLVGLFALVESLISLARKDSATLDKYSVVLASSLVPFLLAYFFDATPYFFMTTVMLLIPSLFLSILFSYLLKYKARLPREFRLRLWEDKQLFHFAVLLLVAVVILVGLLIKFEWVFNVLLGLLKSTEPEAGKLGQTVAEGRQVSFGEAYSAMQWFGLPFLLAIPYLALARLIKWKSESTDLLPVIFGASTFKIYLSMSKYALLFAPAFSLLPAILISDVALSTRIKETLGSRHKHFLAVMCIAVVLMLVPFVQRGIEQHKAMAHQYSPQPQWVSALKYISEREGHPVVMAWWDYGHWITALTTKGDNEGISRGNAYALVDNMNVNESKDIQVAKVFTAFDTNTTRLEMEVAPDILHWNVDYIMVDRLLLWKKWGALTFLSDRQCILRKDLESKGMSFAYHPKLEAICHYARIPSGSFGILPCHFVQTYGEHHTEEWYECLLGDAPIRFSKEEWHDLVEASSYPGREVTIALGEKEISFRTYAMQDKVMLVNSIAGNLVHDSATNYMFAPSLFFGRKFKCITPVKDERAFNNEVRTFKVDKQCLRELLGRS